VLISPESDEILVAIKLDFPTTNNEVEYKAIMVDLGIAKELGAKSDELRRDSQVVVGHVDGTFEAKWENMIKFLTKVHEFYEQFDHVVFTQVLRAQNARVDSLARLGSAPNKEVERSKQEVRVLSQPSIAAAEMIMQVDDIYDSPDWARDVIEYLRRGTLPDDKKEARKV